MSAPGSRRSVSLRRPIVNSGLSIGDDAPAERVGDDQTGHRVGGRLGHEDSDYKARRPRA